MKRLIIFLSALFLGLSVNGQQQADSLHETAKMFMRQGDYDNAQLVLQRAHALNPGDVSILKDQAFVYYLQRDFAHAISAGTALTSRPDADVQSFQILGLAYKAIAEYKLCDKMYKDALKKYPLSGVLYSEYGDLLKLEKNDGEAIRQWEKGIETDPGFGTNYYFASKYYAEKGNVLWELLYGETFVNIESLTSRTVEIKNLLLSGYKKLYEGNYLQDITQKGTPFEKAVATILLKQAGITAMGLSPESLTALRTRFILGWEDSYASAFPYRLFELHLQLLQEGMFDAYNQWLFGAASSASAYEIWTHLHTAEVADLKNFQDNVLYKVPDGQYYPH